MFNFADIVYDGQNTGLIVFDGRAQIFVYLHYGQNGMIVAKVNYSNLCAKRKKDFRLIKRINRKLSRHQMDSIILEINKMSYYNNAAVGAPGALDLTGKNPQDLSVNFQNAFLQRILFNAGILDYYLGEIPDPTAAQYLYFGPKINYTTLNLLPNYIRTT
jgi:hypothetical protein